MIFVITTAKLDIMHQRCLLDLQRELRELRMGAIRLLEEEVICIPTWQCVCNLHGTHVAEMLLLLLAKSFETL